MGKTINNERTLKSMRVPFATPSAYLYSDDRGYIQGGSRWSHSSKFYRLEAEKLVKKLKHSYTPYPFFLGYADSYVSNQIYVDFIDKVAMNYNKKQFLELVEEKKLDLVVMETTTVIFLLTTRPISDIKRETWAEITAAGIHIISQYLNEMKNTSLSITPCLMSININSRRGLRRISNWMV